jgi:hypothetical protein
MIGSTGPKIFGSVPSDIDVRGNYFYKQPNWMGHTALSGGITAAQTTIPVASTAGFPDSGVIGIGSETIYYGSKDDISFRIIRPGGMGTRMRPVAVSLPRIRQRTFLS